MSQARRTEILERLNIIDPLLYNTGKIWGVIPITIFSFKTNITGVTKTFWPVATQDRYIIKYTAEYLTIASTSDQDTNLTGTGVWLLRIRGIDEDYVSHLETVEMNGTTGVQTTRKYLAVNELTITSTGSNYGNVGEITAKHGTDILATICNICPVNISMQGVFTVPAETTLMVKFLSLTPGGGDQMRLFIYVTNPVNRVPVAQDIPFSFEHEVKPLPPDSWITVPEKHTLEIAVDSTAQVARSAALSIGSVLLRNDFFRDVPGE